MDRLKIGVAIAIPEPFAAVLAGWRAKVGDPEGTRVPPHVTLLPPTLVGADRVGEIERHLVAAAAATRTFEIHLSGTGTFRPVSDVVFVVVSSGVTQCEQLERLVRCGPLARETRFPYHPHVTVAHDIDQPALDAAHAGLADFDAQFAVSGFTLFEQGNDNAWRPRRVFVLGSRAVGSPKAAGRKAAGPKAAGPKAAGPKAAGRKAGSRKAGSPPVPARQLDPVESLDKPARPRGVPEAPPA